MAKHTEGDRQDGFQRGKSGGDFRDGWLQRLQESGRIKIFIPQKDPMTKKKFRTGEDAYNEMCSDQMDALRYAMGINEIQRGYPANGLTRAKVRWLVKKGRELMEEENGHICSPDSKKRPR